jgi:hypothetical protein
MVYLVATRLGEEGRWAEVALGLGFRFPGRLEEATRVAKLFQT